MTVKILLKQVRETRNLSQNKLAQLIGMSLQNVQRIEYGDAKSIPLETLDKLCQVLNCQPGDLLIRVPDNDLQRENTMIQQKLQQLQFNPVENSEEESSESLLKHSDSWLTILAEFPKSA